MLQQRTGLTFEDVAEEWYERGRFERDWSVSTQIDYRSVLDAHPRPSQLGQPKEDKRIRASLASRRGPSGCRDLPHRSAKWAAP